MNEDTLKSLKRGFGKRAVSTFLAGTLLFSSGGIVKANAYSLDKPDMTYEEFVNYEDVKIFVNGRLVEFNEETGRPFIDDGTTFIPLRAIGEVYNAYVSWSGELRTAYISKQGKSLSVPIGEDTISLTPDLNADLFLRKDKIINLTRKSVVVNGRTYLPLRAIFEAFGSEVIWTGKDRIVIVHDDYEKNSDYIDFKDKKVIEMKDVDVDKKYSEILFDGNEITNDYLKILKNCNDYKVIVDDDKLVVFSYQYLMDLNYLYKQHTLRKNDYTEQYNYDLWSISEKDYEFLQNLDTINNYTTNIYYYISNMDHYGNHYYLKYASDSDVFRKAISIADEIVNEIKNKTDDTKERIILAHDKICSICTPDVGDDGIYSGFEMTAVFVDKLSACQGYSLAFKYLMDKLGIPCVCMGGFVKNSTIPHAWNEVFLDGEWKTVDVEFDDITHGKGRFLKGDFDDFANQYFEINDRDQSDIETIKYTLKFSD